MVGHVLEEKRFMVRFEFVQLDSLIIVDEYILRLSNSEKIMCLQEFNVSNGFHHIELM